MEKYAVKKVNTIAELRDTKGEYEGQIITLLGYYTTNDKPPLKYKWTSADILDDGGYSIQTIKGGTWIANLDYIIDIRHFGAKCDGISLDDDAIENTQIFINTKRPLINISAGNEKGGGILYFPQNVHISKTIVLKKGVSIEGNSKVGTNIHCQEQIIGITNSPGYDENGDIIYSSNFSLKNFTLTQGSIEIAGGSSIEVENIRIMNIVGRNAFTISLFVNIHIKNVHIISCDRVGFTATDSLGTGPSTTLYVDGLWTSHCFIGIVIDGKQGSSHFLITSNFRNIISEYNTTGIILQGNIENVSFDGIHLEQNDTASGIYDSVSVNLNNVWNDKGMIVLYNGDNQYNNKVYLKDIKSQLYVQNGYSGSIFVDSNIEWMGNPNTCIIYNSKGNTYNDSSEYSNRAPIGYTSSDKSSNKIVVFNGTNCVDSQGNIV